MRSKTIFNVTISFVASFFFIWLTGFFLKDSLSAFTYSTVLEKYINQPSSYSFHRSEGRGKSFFGKYGINGYPDITLNVQNKIVIWGDSFVEALQVDDNDKIWSQLNSFLLAAGYSNLISVAIGQSGDSVCDYAVNIPKYERILSGVSTHFIVLNNLSDILPDQPTDTDRAFFKSCPLRIEYSEKKPKYQNLKRILNNIGLYFMWEPVKKLSELKLNFFPSFGKKTASKVKQDKTISEKIEAWGFIFNYLKKQSKDIPIVFVYCPSIPYINNGKIITVDNNAYEKDIFIKTANENSIEVIDLKDKFISNYYNTGKLPCGFQNSRPGFGHFNEMGNNLVAQAIYEFINNKSGKYDIYKH